MSTHNPTRLTWSRRGQVPGPGRYEAERDGYVCLITGKRHPASAGVPARTTYSLTVHELAGLLAGGADGGDRSWTHGPFPSVAAAKREAEDFASAWVPVSGVPDGLRFVDPQGVPLA